MIGQYAPWMQAPRRRTIRAPVNPLDKSTVVSIFPRLVHEDKVTLTPGIFDIPSGTYDKPAILIVGPSSWWKEMEEDQPLLEVTCSSIQIADSIVKDYSNGLLGCDTSDTGPGLFFIPGEFSVEQIKKDHKVRLDLAQTKQRNWYANLVKLADSMWARTNGNPLSIDDLMRLAAQELGMKDKPWLKDFTTIELTPCPSCGTLRNSSFPVCAICRTIVDKKRFEELGLGVQK